AFTTSASVPTTYIQQFWNTLTPEANTKVYHFQLDEDWFTLDANLLREALEITPIDQAHKFMLPHSDDAIIDFMNELGYPEKLYIVSRMVVNNLYQPWRAIFSMINQCLTCKTYGYDRPIAFTTSASVPTTYIQQFWNTLTPEANTKVYHFQLDEDWFTLDANLLREALEITPIDQAHKFMLPHSDDAIIDFMNELGYPEKLHIVSRMVVNNLYQPWRAIFSMINQCLTGKTSGYDRPMYPFFWVKGTTSPVKYITPKKR
nr:hypothetical protein [Tanacetum cinerariifolium]